MKRVLTMMEAVGDYLKTLLLDINFNNYISLQIIPLCYVSVLITTTIALAMLVVHGFMDNIWLGRFPKKGIFVDEDKMFADTLEIFKDLDIKLKRNH